MRTKSPAAGFILILTLLMMTLFALLGNVQVSQTVNYFKKANNSINTNHAKAIANYAAQQARLWLNANAAQAVVCNGASATTCTTLFYPNLTHASAVQDPSQTTWAGWTSNYSIATTLPTKWPNATGASARYVIELMGYKLDGDNNTWPTYRITGFGQTGSNIGRATSIITITPDNYTDIYVNSRLNKATNFPATGNSNPNTVQVKLTATRDAEAGTNVDTSCNSITKTFTSGSANIPMNDEWMFIDPTVVVSGSPGGNQYGSNLQVNYSPKDNLRATNASLCPGDNLGNTYTGIAVMCQVDAQGRVRVGVYSNYDIYNNTNGYGGAYQVHSGGNTANTAILYNSQHNPVCNWSFGPWSTASVNSTSSLEIPTDTTDTYYTGGTCTTYSSCPDGTNNHTTSCGAYCSSGNATYCQGGANTSVSNCTLIYGCTWCNWGGSGTCSGQSSPNHPPTCPMNAYTRGTPTLISGSTGSNLNGSQCPSGIYTGFYPSGETSANNCDPAGECFNGTDIGCYPPSSSTESYTYCAFTGACHDYSASCSCETPGCPGCVGTNYCSNGIQSGQYQYNNYCSNCTAPGSYPNSTSYSAGASQCNSEATQKAGGASCTQTTGNYYTTYTFTCTVQSALPTVPTF